MVPLHSNNASIHFLSSTLPLSKRLKLLAPNALSSISFPQILHGHRLSFFSNPSQEFNHNSYSAEIIEGIPSTFWLSRVLHKVPMDPKFRKKILREILDSDHLLHCQTTTFHPKPTLSCLCTLCGEPSSCFHNRFCTTAE